MPGGDAATVVASADGSFNQEPSEDLTRTLQKDFEDEAVPPEPLNAHNAPGRMHVLPNILAEGQKDQLPAVDKATEPRQTGAHIPDDKVGVIKSSIPETDAFSNDSGQGLTRQKRSSQNAEEPRTTRERRTSNASTKETRFTEQGQDTVNVTTSEKQHKSQNSFGAPSEWSHQQLAPSIDRGEDASGDDEQWQVMPAYAPFDIYGDDNKLIAREHHEDDEELAYGMLGGAGKGYTRLQLDEDAQSATSMDDNTAYLFKEQGTNVQDEDDDARDALSQLQATKSLLTETQRIAYVGLVRLAMIEMMHTIERLERTKNTKKAVDYATESYKMWSQKTMVRLYAHMEVEAPEQVMIEQLTEHGILATDLAPSLLQNARVINPARSSISSSRPSMSSRQGSIAPSQTAEASDTIMVASDSLDGDGAQTLPPLPAYQEHADEDIPPVQSPSQLPQTKTIDIDLKWTVLCDLFLLLVADSVYDSRSRRLLELVGDFLGVTWTDICRFEKRVTDALEMQEAASKENWNEEDHMENRRKLARNKRLMLMGLATVGGGLVIGLSAGLLAPVIGAGLAAGFTTIGVAGTGGFLAGAGGAAIITTTGMVTGGAIAVKATGRRTGAVKTFEYRPLHNNKRVNLIVSVSGWMTGKVDDVRLPFSTVDPVMGDIYSVFWEPEMLQSMGDTINILATEALTQGLQQVLGSTILIALMAALQLPIVLTKLAYLIDNPWSVSVARADAAGLILADSLMDRNLGSRPVTLVGFSLGSRVIFSCLRELCRKGQTGLVQNAYLFGTPVIANKDEWIKARSVVSGRVVNGYANNDWILGYLFRATGGGIMRVAGLAPVEIPGIENINVTEMVPGHMSYRKVMPKLLRSVGWAVESDEFSEIEDPDPDNHEKRQRELINEIEEARKKLQEKPEKKRWALFSRKKMAEKKNWEMYDEKSQVEAGHTDAHIGQQNVLFDIDAIRKEVAALSAEGIAVKELETTMPPMKLDIKGESRMPSLRQSRSLNDVQVASSLKKEYLSSESGDRQSSDRADVTSVGGAGARDDGKMSLKGNDEIREGPHSVTLARPALSSGTAASSLPLSAGSHPGWQPDVAARPPLTHATTTPSALITSDYMRNAWAEDDDEFGPEPGEMKMTFE